MNRLPIILSLLITLLVMYKCEKLPSESSKDKLYGTWTVKSIKWIYPDTTYHLEAPQPGFLQFTPGRYSFIWTPSEKKRTPFQKLSEPSAEEMQAGFRSLVLNAGTYVRSDSTITIKAEIAKVPGFEGGTQVFDYSLRNDSLTYIMVDETYPGGGKPTWAGKLRTEFILVRLGK